MSDKMTIKAVLHAGEPGDVDRGEVILRIGADDDDSGVGYSMSPDAAYKLGLELITRSVELRILARVSGVQPTQKEA